MLSTKKITSPDGRTSLWFALGETRRTEDKDGRWSALAARPWPRRNQAKIALMKLCLCFSLMEIEFRETACESHELFCFCEGVIGGTIAWK